MIKPASILRRLIPGVVWKIKTEKKILYLTFDDGPIEVITPWVLEVLNQYNAKATFFCVGENVKRNPNIFRQLIRNGHSVGNHTMTHLNGWKVNKKNYLNDIEECTKYIDSELYRPPYGKLTPTQLIQIRKKYKVVMWDVLSYDFDKRQNPQKVYENVIKYAKEGSIVTFHDSAKAQENLEFALPAVLEFYTQRGYRFEAIKKIDS